MDKQIQRLISKMDELEDTNMKKTLFDNLGTNCYTCRHVDEWVEGFNHDLNEMIRWVATGESRFWEKLELDESNDILYLTGKEVDSCVCEYNDSDKPNQSLCLYCCKKFQETLWGALLDTEVEVEITESVILGGSRCNTKIYINQ